MPRLARVERAGTYVLLGDLLHEHHLPELPRSKEFNTTTLFMTPPEAGALLDILLTPPVQTYVEWGSGGSTELVSWLLLAAVLPRRSTRAVSVESSEKWTQHLRSRSSLVRRAEAEGLMLLLASSYGPQTMYGHPANTTRGQVVDPWVLAGAARYVRAPFNVPSLPSIDVALVDGRFRVACALEVLKHATSATRLLMHDYGKSRQRAEYARVLKFYKMERQVDSLAIFTPRADAMPPRWMQTAIGLTRGPPR